MDGKTIARQRGLARMECYDVELDTRDVKLADGAASESFTDDGSRSVLLDTREHATLHPDAAAPSSRCASLVERGPALEAIRLRMAELLDCWRS